MKRFSTKLTTLAVTLALAAFPLAACGNSDGTNSGADEPAPATSQDAGVDTSSWATMGDALAVADSDDISYSYDESTFVCVFKSGEATIRTVAEVQPGIDEKFADLDMFAEDYRQKFTEAVADLKLVEAADITADCMSQEDLQQYVGKTYQDLLDAGFTFASYNMYGGEQTGADLDKGYYAYDFTFDAQVSEDQTEDGGAALTDATVVEAQSLGNLSNAALDPAAAR